MILKFNEDICELSSTDQENIFMNYYLSCQLQLCNRVPQDLVTSDSKHYLKVSVGQEFRSHLAE